MAFPNVCKSVVYWPSEIIILHDNRYLYILKKILRVVFGSGGTSNEDPEWI
jgi:hypothetical protein